MGPDVPVTLHCGIWVPPQEHCASSTMQEFLPLTLSCAQAVPTGTGVVHSSPELLHQLGLCGTPGSRLELNNAGSQYWNWIAIVGLEQLLLPFWNVVVVGNTYVWTVPLPPGSVNEFDPPWLVVCGGVVNEVMELNPPHPLESDASARITD